MIRPDSKDDAGRCRTFEEFLKQLDSTAARPDQIAALCRLFHSLYDDGWRHSYAAVTGFIFDRLGKDGIRQADGLETRLGNMTDNLSTLQAELEHDYEHGPTGQSQAEAEQRARLHERSCGRLRGCGIISCPNTSA